MTACCRATVSLAAALQRTGAAGPVSIRHCNEGRQMAALWAAQGLQAAHRAATGSQNCAVRSQHLGLTPRDRSESTTILFIKKFTVLTTISKEHRTYWVGRDLKDQP